jgi:hypothetical protein
MSAKPWERHACMRACETDGMRELRDRVWERMEGYLSLPCRARNTFGVLASASAILISKPSFQCQDS